MGTDDPHGQHAWPPQPGWTGEPHEPTKAIRPAVLVGCAAAMLLAFAGVTAVFLTFYNGWWGVDAMNVCRRLRAEDVAVDCHAIAHRGLLNVAADDVVEFNVRGSDATGQVMYFRKRNDYKAALVAYTIASVIGGTVHGSAAARILVETGHGSPTRAVKFAKRVVDEL